MQVKCIAERHIIIPSHASCRPRVILIPRQIYGNASHDRSLRREGVRRRGYVNGLPGIAGPFLAPFQHIAGGIGDVIPSQR